MSALAFQESTQADDAEIVALWRACGLTRPWNDPHADLAFARTQPHAAVLAGRGQDGRILATVMVGHDGHRGWVYYLAADPETRRRGLGGVAMAAAETWLRERGVWKLNIIVRNDNAEVLAFYRAIGFVEDDCIVLSRRLDGRSPQQPYPGAEDWS